MTRRPLHRTLLAVVLIGAGCSSSGDEAAPTTALTDTAAASATEAAGATTPALADSPLPLCSKIPDNTDSLDFSGAQYSDFPDQVATVAAIDFAITRGQYVAAWSRDRHETWTIVGVTSEMTELQAELDAMFPRARVLFMNVDWTPEDLAQLAGDVAVTLGLDRSAVSWSIASGYVTLDASALGADSAGVLQSYAGLPVCIADR
jgi:hypothetical protein